MMRVDGDETARGSVDLPETVQREKYLDFVRRAARNPIARRVKLADIEDNLDVRRIQCFSDRDATRVRRYHEARRVLIEAGARLP